MCSKHGTALGADASGVLSSPKPFAVRDVTTGERLRYIGQIAKVRLHTEADMTMLAAGQSVQVSVHLSSGFRFQAGHAYAVEWAQESVLIEQAWDVSASTNLLAQAGAGPGLAAVDVPIARGARLADLAKSTSPNVVVRLAHRGALQLGTLSADSPMPWERAGLQKVPALQIGTVSYVGCSASQQTLVASSVANALTMAQNAYDFTFGGCTYSVRVARLVPAATLVDVSVHVVACAALPLVLRHLLHSKRNGRCGRVCQRNFAVQPCCDGSRSTFGVLGLREPADSCTRRWTVPEPAAEPTCTHSCIRTSI